MSTIELHSRHRRWFRIVLNPLTTKELRATFRQPRFLIVYWISLVLYSLVVLMVAWSKVSKEALTAGQPVGQLVFNYCVAAQLVLMVFVLPGFGASALTDERENQSFDLLVTTALSAFDIVWGKFLACMGYAFLFLSATFPLVCVSVLFTGVRPSEIVFGYAVMTMVAMLMTAIGLTSSAFGRSSRRSVAVTYGVALAVAVGCSTLGYRLYGKAEQAGYSESNLVGFVYDSVFRRGWSSTVWMGLVPFAAWAFALALLLIVSVDRLKPSSANKSTKLRILGVLLVAAVLVTALTDFLTVPVKTDELTGRGLTVLEIGACLLAICLVGAACEEPRLSRRVQRQYAWARGLKWPLRVLLPGSASGLTYVLLLGAVLFGASTWALSEIALPMSLAKADPVAAARLPQAQAALYWTAALLAAMIWFFAALGRLLSTVFAGPIYSRTMVIFAFVMANLLPVCILTLADQTASDTKGPSFEHPSTPWNLHYTSAILSLRSVADMTGFGPLPERGLFHSKLVILTWGLELPVGRASVAFHATLAALLTVLGAWRQRRVIRQRLTVLYPPWPDQVVTEIARYRAAQVETTPKAPATS